MTEKTDKIIYVYGIIFMLLNISIFWFWRVFSYHIRRVVYEKCLKGIMPLVITRIAFNTSGIFFIVCIILPMTACCILTFKRKNQLFVLHSLLVYLFLEIGLLLLFLWAYCAPFISLSWLEYQHTN